MPRLQEQTLNAIREEIEKQAVKLFIKKGFAATSTREIADAVGSSPGAMYTHYPSKEALFASVVERYQMALQAEENQLKAVLRKAQFPNDLVELAAAIKDVVQRHHAYWLLWYVDVLEFGGKHFKSMLAPQALVHLPELKGRFEKLARQKALRIDPETAFIMIYMQFFNYYIIESVFKGEKHYGVGEDQAIRSMIEVFLHGVQLREAKGQP